MDKLMNWLAPRGTLGFITRLVVLIGIVAIANLLFSAFVDDHPLHEPSYYILHAFFVGGPLIAFFLTVTVFQIRLQRKLSRLSRKDGLTGLNNRRTFFALADAARAEETNGVLMMLDADWFKRINDSYGHQAGDKCLKAISATLRSNTRKGDVVGRIGGEEFAIYLRDTSVSHASIIGERLTRPIGFQTDDGQTLQVTLSIGATISKKEGTLDDLFAAADGALYKAKVKGRAAMVFWDEALTDTQGATPA